MQLVILGLNHKTVPVEIRERFSLSSGAIRQALTCLDDYDGIDEAVVLSTCNRSEVYAVVDDEKANLQAMKDFFFSLTGACDDEPGYFYYYTGKDCIQHLFEVAASLDSLIIGEGQILSQVKQAYAMAHECDATDAVLNLLFHQAIATGKRVRTETHIAYSAVSVSYAAVQLAGKIFADLKDRGILIYGAGQMAELTARNFCGKGASRIFVVNRHIERARELAGKIGGQAVHFKDAPAVSPDIDIIITSTGAPHYVVSAADAVDLMERRQGRPLLIIDIAVPRDVDPVVGEMEQITLYNIDELESVVHDNELNRKREAAVAAGIVQEDTLSLTERFRYLSMRPVMLRLSRKADRMRRHELKRALTKLPNITDQQYKVVEHLSRMIVRKLLRDPMTQATLSAGTEEEEFFTRAMTSLFKLDIVKENSHCETGNHHRHTK